MILYLTLINPQKVLNMKCRTNQNAKLMPSSLHPQQPNYSDRHWYITQSRDTENQNSRSLHFSSMVPMKYFCLSTCLYDGGFTPGPSITSTIRLHTCQYILPNTNLKLSHNFNHLLLSMDPPEFRSLAQFFCKPSIQWPPIQLNKILISVNRFWAATKPHPQWNQ